MRVEAKRAATVLTALALTSCSLFDPKFYPPRAGSDPNQKQFNAAVERSEKLFQDYSEGRNEMRLYALASGVTLYGLAVAGLGLALFQAPNNALLGVGLAAAGVGGLRALLPFDLRQKAYAVRNCLYGPFAVKGIFAGSSTLAAIPPGAFVCRRRLSSLALGRG